MSICETLKQYKRSREKIITLIEYLMYHEKQENITKELILSKLEECESKNEKDEAYLENKFEILLENIKNKQKVDESKIKRKRQKRVKEEEINDKELLDFLKRNKLTKKVKIEELEITPELIKEDISKYVSAYPIKNIVLFTDINKLEEYFNSSEFNFEDLVVFIPDINWLKEIEEFCKGNLSEYNIVTRT